MDRRLRALRAEITSRAISVINRRLGREGSLSQEMMVGRDDFKGEKILGVSC